MRTVTMKDIAEKAGVARQTVSEVLNKAPYSRVKKETRERVLRLAREMRYRPNVLAQSLRSGKTNTIAVVSAQRVMGGFNSEYEMGLFAGISEHFLGSRYQLTFEAAGLFYHPDTLEKLALGGKYDGVLLVLYSNAYKMLKTERFKGVYPMPDPRIPVVEIENVKHPLGSHAVCTDMFAAAGTAAAHLAEHGYETIGIITDGDAEMPVNVEQQAGFEAGLEKAGFDIAGISHHNTGVHTMESGMDLAERMIRDGKLPRALFICGETIAYGMAKVFKDKGVRVPEDIAVIVNSNVMGAASALCDFTCLSQPVREKGRAAAQLLQDLMENGKSEPVCKMIPAELLVRKSCGCNAG